MKISITVIALLFITLYACENSAQYSEQQTYSQTESESQFGQDDIVLKDIISPTTQQANVSIPVPSSWTVHNPQPYDKPYITGPDGVTVTVYSPKNFYFNLNRQQAQFFSQSGKQVLNPVPLNNYFQNNIKPSIISRGSSILNVSSPETLLKKKRSADQLAAKAHRMQISDGELIMVEVQNSNNSKSILIIQKTVVSSQNVHFWSILIEEMNSPAASFAKNKVHYVHALLNTQLNSREIYASAEIMRQKSQQQMAQNRAYSQSMAQQSFQAHQARMKSNQAAFQKTQQIHTSTSNAISDMSMQGWRNRNASSDYMQQQSVNAIHNQNTVNNPHTNHSGQVQSGYNYYYINSNGEYIGTNNAFYNPANDPNIGHQNWKRVEN